MKRTTQYPTYSLFRGLRTLLTSLPSEEEKSELIKTLSETRDFLQEIQVLIEAFPTAESGRDLSNGLSRLDILAERAGREGRLRRVMGLSSSAVPKVKRVNGSEDVESRARVLNQKLNNSDTSDFESLIEQSGEPKSVLTELAALIGLKARSKEGRSDLIKRIATHTENRRGYKLLRGEDPDAANDAVVRATSNNRGR